MNIKVLIDILEPVNGIGLDIGFAPRIFPTWKGQPAQPLF